MKPAALLLVLVPAVVAVGGCGSGLPPVPTAATWSTAAQTTTETTTGPPPTTSATPTTSPTPVAQAFAAAGAGAEVDVPRPRRPTTVYRPPTPAPRVTTTVPRTTTAQKPAPPAKKASGGFRNCTEAKAAGAAPLYRGQAGYSRKLDRDGDGVACER